MNITLAFKKYDIKPSFSDKLLDKAIKSWTKSPYFHCEIIINDDWISSSPEAGSVYRNKLKELKSNYDYITIEVDGRKNKKVQKFIDSQLGKKYDYFGIFFSQIIDVELDNKNKWFCSEIVAYILKMYGVNLEEKSNQYSPGKLYKRIYRLDI